MDGRAQLGGASLTTPHVFVPMRHMLGLSACCPSHAAEDMQTSRPKVLIRLTCWAGLIIWKPAHPW